MTLPYLEPPSVALSERSYQMHVLGVAWVYSGRRLMIGSVAGNRDWFGGK